MTYDAEVDALYIRFLEGTVTTTEFPGGIALDRDAEGRLAGIEILDVTHSLGKDALRQVSFENIGPGDPDDVTG